MSLGFDKQNDSLRALHCVRLHRWLMGVLSDWFVIVLAVFAVEYTRQWFIGILAIFVIGTKQHALGIMGHDGAHYLASKHRKLNDFLTNLLCFWPFGVDLSGYRKFHFLHHQNLGTLQDPELADKKEGFPIWDIPLVPKRLAIDFARDLCGFNFGQLFRIIYYTRSKGLVPYIGPVMTIATILTVLILNGHYWAILLWYIALGTSYVAVFRLRIWTEHVGTRGTYRLWIPRWLDWIFAPHNTWCHWEHHKYTYVPYWKLIEARRLDTSEPWISLKQLFQNFQKTPYLRSGEIPPS